MEFDSVSYGVKLNRKVFKVNKGFWNNEMVIYKKEPKWCAIKIDVYQLWIISMFFNVLWAVCKHDTLWSTFVFLQSSIYRWLMGIPLGCFRYLVVFIGLRQDDPLSHICLFWDKVFFLWLKKQSKWWIIFMAWK